MKQSVKRLISMVVSLIFLVGAFVLFFYFVQPAYQDMLDLKSQLGNLEVLRAEQEVIFKNLQGLISTYNESQEVREIVSLALPLNPSVAEFVAQINGLAINNNLTAQFYSISPILEPVISEEDRRQEGKEKSITNVKPVNTISFSARLSGSYSDFKNFLKQLETNVRVFDIKTISIQPASQENSDLYFYDLTVETYYQYNK